MIKENRKIYKKYIKNIFKPSIQKELAEEFGLTKQRISAIIKDYHNEFEKEMVIYRKKLLIEKKYSLMNPKGFEEKEAVVQSMVLDGFNYREVEDALKIDKNKVGKMLRDFDCENLGRLTKKIFNA